MGRGTHRCSCSLLPKRQAQFTCGVVRLVPSKISRGTAQRLDNFAFFLKEHAHDVIHGSGCSKTSPSLSFLNMCTFGFSKSKIDIQELHVCLCFFFQNDKHRLHVERRLDSMLLCFFQKKIGEGGVTMVLFQLRVFFNFEVEYQKTVYIESKKSGGSAHGERRAVCQKLSP
jgi:hypothetical protein